MGDAARLLQSLGLSFNDEGLFRRALTHRSHGKENNERLEFLGDSILGFVVADWLYQRFPELSEGALSRMRAVVVRKEALVEVARDMQLAEALSLGEGERKSGGHNRDSILADALEAIIGALYLDSGIESARAFVLRGFESHLDALTPDTAYKDPKSRLQEWLQARGLPVPQYHIIAVSGEPHNQVFEVSCSIQGVEEPFTASGKSRRGAEQAAAERAYSTLSDK